VKGRLSESGISTPLWGVINATCYAGGFLHFHFNSGDREVIDERKLKALASELAKYFEIASSFNQL